MIAGFYGIYSVSACQKLMLVPEDMVKTEDVGYQNRALYYDGVQRF